jgi:hypothetical protein
MTVLVIFLLRFDAAEFPKGDVLAGLVVLRKEGLLIFVEN